MLRKPYKGDGNYIFISYSHRDINEVLRFIETLQGNGYNVWYDEGIDPGTEWDENIAKHIKECAYFISFITEDYIQSQNCRDELTYARDLNKERLLIYGEEVDLPEGMKMRMNRLQAVFKYKYKDEQDFFSKVFQADGLDACKTGNLVEAERQSITESQPTDNRKRKLIIIAVIALLSIIVVVFAVTNSNKSSDNSSSSTATEESGSTNGDTGTSDESEDSENANSNTESDIEQTHIKNGVTLECDTGEATLTGYSKFKKGKAYYLVLFFDFTNPDDQPQTFANNLQASVFQNGVELEFNGDTSLLSTDGQDVQTKSFTKLQKGASIHCGWSYILTEPSGKVTIQLFGFNYDGERVTVEQDLTIK